MTETEQFHTKRIFKAIPLQFRFVTVGELYEGTLKAIAKGKWNKNRLAKLEERFRITLVLPYDFAVCKVYGALKGELKNADGSDRTVGSNDLWIAACAKQYSLDSLVLVTNNRKDFTGLPALISFVRRLP